MIFGRHVGFDILYQIGPGDRAKKVFHTSKMAVKSNMAAKSAILDLLPNLRSKNLLLTLSPGLIWKSIQKYTKSPSFIKWAQKLPWVHLFSYHILSIYSADFNHNGDFLFTFKICWLTSFLYCLDSFIIYFVWRSIYSLSDHFSKSIQWVSIEWINTLYDNYWEISDF